MTITRAWLDDNLGKARTKIGTKADGMDGLSVRMSIKGKLTYQLRYRHGDKPKRTDIGSYPLLSLQKAREECKKLLSELELGYDPKVVKKVTKVNAPTFKLIFEKWYDKYLSISNKRADKILRHFEIHVFPKFVDIPASAISTTLWMDLLLDIRKEAPSVSASILKYTKQVYTWFSKNEILIENPLDKFNVTEDLHVGVGEGARDLSHTEVNLILKVLRESSFYPKTKVLIKLALLFGCRGHELVQAEKEHFDFDTKLWSVPTTHHKSGKKTKKKLIRPIIPAAEELLLEAFTYSKGSKFVFPSSKNTHDVPQDVNTLRNATGSVIRYARVNYSINMANWTPHSLRKTARTNWSTLTQPHIAELMHGHALPKIWGVYDQHTYTNEMRDAYQKWWNKINRDNIVTSEELIVNLKQEKTNVKRKTKKPKSEVKPLKTVSDQNQQLVLDF